MLHWASLIIFFALSVLALWVTYSYLQKNGFYFFCIVSSIVCAYFSKVELFHKVFSVQMVVIPVILLALLLCYRKFGKEESIRLFYVTIFSQITMFVLKFFEFAFLDLTNGTIKYLTWAYLNNYVGTIIALLCCCIGGFFFVEYVKLQKVPVIIRTSIYIGIFSIANSLVFITIAYSGYFSFVDILLTFLLYVAFDIVLSLLLGCFKFLIFTENSLLHDANQNKKIKENDNKQKEKNKTLSNYFNKKEDNTTQSSSTPSSKSSNSIISNISNKSSSSYGSKNSSVSKQYGSRSATKPSSTLSNRSSTINKKSPTSKK